MTNSDIIFGHSVALMREGILKGTGQFLKMTVLDADGKEQVREREMPEEIHTFAAWKEMGFSVKKGEHAITKFPVWKYVQEKASEALDDGLVLAEDNGKCIMKMAHFFTRAQVEPIAAKA